MTIKFLKTNEAYGFLSNFKKTKMYIGGRWWNNSEAPYQAAKTVTREDEELIWNAKTPREARDLGQKVKLRSDWDRVKDRCMYDCIMAKFLQNHDLRKQLMDTGSEELMEDHEDQYWASGLDGKGKNKLGKILMQVREELKGEDDNIVLK